MTFYCHVNSLNIAVIVRNYVHYMLIWKRSLPKCNSMLYAENFVNAIMLGFHRSGHL